MTTSRSNGSGAGRSTIEGEPVFALQAAQRLLSGTDTEFTDHMDIAEVCGHGHTERLTLPVAARDDTLFPGSRQVFRPCRDTGGIDGVRLGKEAIYGIVSSEHFNNASAVAAGGICRCGSGRGEG